MSRLLNRTPEWRKCAIMGMTGSKVWGGVVSLPDITHDCPDALDEIYTERVSIYLPTPAGTLNRENRALAEYAKASEQLLPDDQRRAVYPAVDQAVRDAQPLPLAKPLAWWQIVLLILAPGAVILAGWLIGCGWANFCWWVGQSVGAL